MKTSTLALILLAVLIMICIVGCQYFSGVTFSGHISGRYLRPDSTPVLLVVAGNGDTAHVATTRETYDNMIDIWYEASADDDEVIRIDSSRVPSGYYAAQQIDWSDTVKKILDPATTAGLPAAAPALMDSTRIRYLDSVRRSVDIVTVGR